MFTVGHISLASTTTTTTSTTTSTKTHITHAITNFKTTTVPPSYLSRQNTTITKYIDPTDVTRIVITETLIIIFMSNLRNVQTLSPRTTTKGVLQLFGLLLLLNISVVKSACPNSCSGHGTCNKFDECTCYVEQRDGSTAEIPAWREPDCSARTCPRGISHIHVPEYGQAGEIYNHQSNAECSDRGACNTMTGECECYDGWTGSACQYCTYHVMNGLRAGVRAALKNKRRFSPERSIFTMPPFRCSLPREYVITTQLTRICTKHSRSLPRSL